MSNWATAELHLDYDGEKGTAYYHVGHDKWFGEVVNNDSIKFEAVHITVLIAEFEIAVKKWKEIKD